MYAYEESTSKYKIFREMQNPYHIDPQRLM